MPTDYTHSAWANDKAVCPPYTADALHLAASLQTEQFVTFDKRMVNKANAININQVVSLLEVKDN